MAKSKLDFDELAHGLGAERRGQTRPARRLRRLAQQPATLSRASRALRTSRMVIRPLAAAVRASGGVPLSKCNEAILACPTCDATQFLPAELGRSGLRGQAAPPPYASF